MCTLRKPGNTSLAFCASILGHRNILFQIMATILFIIAKQDFRDEEYFVPKQTLEQAGHEIKTASNDKTGETAIGFLGGEAKIDITLEDVHVDDYDAVIFVGGSGALKHLNNELSYRICRETVERNKLLASICISPVILAKAGVLRGKKATVWNSPLEQQPVKLLQENGVIYIHQDVVQYGNIITASGPEAAREFGEKILEFFKKQKI